MYLALEEPWESVAPEMMRVVGLLSPGPEHEARWLDWIRPLIEKSPVPIVTLYDWHWWIGYACKLQGDCMHLLLNRECITQELIDSHIHFYLSPEWHQWTFHNQSRLFEDKLVWASHKQPLKKFIFDFDGDEEYYAGKLKVKSAHNVFGYQIGVDDRLNIIHFGCLSASAAKMSQRYGTALERFARDVDEEWEEEILLPDRAYELPAERAEAGFGVGALRAAVARILCRRRG